MTTFHTFISSISCLHLPIFRSQASKVSEKSTVFVFSRVTDEALIAKTMVWPNFFFMNVFFALKESKLFYDYFIQKSQSEQVYPCCKIGQGQPRVLF